MKILIDTIPDNTDGLSTIQRAILRYLLDKPNPPNTSKMILDMLRNHHCPSTITAESIDATILSLCHPAYCIEPIIEMIGSLCFEDGRIQAPVYRTVRLKNWACSCKTDMATNWWSNDPLPLRCPFALNRGCATWEYEVIEDYFPAQNETAERRLRCACLHILGSSESSILMSLDRYKQARSYDELLFKTNENGRFVGCKTLQIMKIFNNYNCLLPLETLLWNACDDLLLPHGLCAGVMKCERTGTLPDYSVISLPELRLIHFAEGVAVYVDQPACGRHIGEELLILLKACDSYQIISTDDIALPVLILRDGFAFKNQSEILHEIRLIPLDDAVFKMMLE